MNSDENGHRKFNIYKRKLSKKIILRKRKEKHICLIDPEIQYEELMFGKAL